MFNVSVDVESTSNAKFFLLHCTCFLLLIIHHHPQSCYSVHIVWIWDVSFVFWSPGCVFQPLHEELRSSGRRRWWWWWWSWAFIIIIILILNSTGLRFNINTLTGIKNWKLLLTVSTSLPPLSCFDTAAASMLSYRSFHICHRQPVW